MKEKGRNRKEWKIEREKSEKRHKILMRSKYFHIKLSIAGKLELHDSVVWPALYMVEFSWDNEYLAVS